MGSPLHKTTSGHGTTVLEKSEPAGLSPEMKLVRDALFRHVGKPLPRKEDGRLITGKGRFSDDFSLPGQTFAAMVRSPYPHARILSIDTSDALASPGVLTVLTGADVLCRRT